MLGEAINGHLDRLMLAALSERRGSWRPVLGAVTAVLDGGGVWPAPT